MSTVTAREPLLSIMTSYLKEISWEYQRFPSHTLIRMGFEGRSGNWYCFVRSYEQDERLVVYSICPVRCAEAQRENLAIFLTLANYGLIIGNFEMNWDNGELRYKTSVDVEGGELTMTMCQQLLQTNCAVMDRYFAALLGVIHGQLSPSEASCLVGEDVVSES